jgi:hypothetical protein
MLYVTPFVCWIAWFCVVLISLRISGGILTVHGVSASIFKRLLACFYGGLLDGKDTRVFILHIPCFLGEKLGSNQICSHHRQSLLGDSHS